MCTPCPTCVDVSKAHVSSPSSQLDDEGVAEEVGGEGDTGEEDQQAAGIHHRGAARALATIARFTRQPLTAEEGLFPLRFSLFYQDHRGR